MVILAGLPVVDRTKVTGISDLHCDRMDGNSELTGAPDADSVIDSTSRFAAISSAKTYCRELA
ncbi:uncharacterized protein METZ01_LOCUS292352 [marine metagenome]|uniref:Uncharacterized protein n=1 Tax=marine metagenome TaxID=408172 RepID=A0A382LS54_9ZZZZ